MPEAARTRFPIAAKFALMLAVLAAAMVAVGWAGLHGLANLDGRVKGLYGDHIVTLQRTTAFARDTSRAQTLSLEIIASNKAPDIARLEAELDALVVPRINTDIAALRRAHAKDPPGERAAIGQLVAPWNVFLALLRRGPIDFVVSGSSAAQHDNALSSRVRAIFDPIEAKAAQQVDLETSQAAGLARQARNSYDASRNLLILIGALAIVLGALVTALIVRAVVPRIRRYSEFALKVADGHATSTVEVSGSDELSDLGNALNDMVRRRVTERAQEEASSEFAEVMQLTETEEEAHLLLKRQIERLVPVGDTVILNRNNSADRLEATTPLTPGSPLVKTLENAKPRSCLAVRFARTHRERGDVEPLVSCDVCGKSSAFTTCEPLLVGGEVIGSVLSVHPAAIGDGELQSIKQTVSQAAPVLANLRNLAIAERRAETDSLTGLPNNRNVADTVKRMSAHAARTVSSLAALALDLDHFKQINDTYGHAAGDDVLAAVGATLKACCRESDFVGRAGGEEFILLLPDSDIESALRVAEKIRVAVSSVSVPSVEREISTSIGVAVMPEHAGDANSLIRHADRALYTAKNNGRNRVETFTREMIPSRSAVENGQPV